MESKKYKTSNGIELKNVCILSNLNEGNGSGSLVFIVVACVMWGSIHFWVV